jgi:hypothetical protein
MPDYLLCSRESMWLVFRMILWAVIVLFYFAWLLSFPMWVLMLMG